MYKYPSIGQFRNAVQSVRYHAQFIGKDANGDPIYDETLKAPTLEYEGTIKTHGTNAAIVIDYTGDEVVSSYQSRSQVITPEKDNCGFAKWCLERDLAQTLDFSQSFPTCPVVKIYGEFCGKGIQKGTAVSELNKMFIIFSIQVGDVVWANSKIFFNKFSLPELNTYTVYDFQTYKMNIDFNKPEESTNKMVDLVQEVERECPVGRKLGVSGIGEGIVWKCITEDWDDEPRFWFKTKGEKHQSSKTKTLVPVDVERLDSIKELAKTFVTESRLNQGMETMTFDRKNLGSFLGWISQDIIKEESDTISQNGFAVKEVCNEAVKMAREWFFQKEKEKIGV